MTNYYFNDNEILALYRGENLLYERVVGDGSGYEINNIVGKSKKTTPFTFKYNGVLSHSITPESDGTFDYTFNERLTSCVSMFYMDADLLAIYHLPPTTDVTSMNMMFSGCSSVVTLDLSHLDTGKVKSMSKMFNCNKLTTLDISSFNTSNVTNMSEMFYACTVIDTLDVSSFNTSNVTNMSEMFRGCNKLTTLVFGNFDMSSVTNTTDMFYYCIALKNVSGNITGLTQTISLSSSPLTNASAMVFINGLADVTTKPKITFKSTTYITLNSEQIAIATAKGWSVVSSYG